MSKIKTLNNLLKNNRGRISGALFDNATHTGILNYLPDEIFLKLAYRAHMHKKLNLSKPQTFNEKLQWLKLHDRRPEYVTMVDKIAVKDYVGGLIGYEHIIPTLGVWDTPEKIDFDELPDQFVLKCNHDSGSVIICRDKSKLDKERAVKKLKKALRRNLYWYSREWPYKDVPAKVFAEKYIAHKNGGELVDYKFMCFNGVVKCSFVCSDRFTSQELHVTFFDRQWNVMPFERSHPAVWEGLQKPSRYDDMINLAEKLSKDLPFVRVDFYNMEGEIYFGELTLYPGAGFEKFSPDKWDNILGEWIKLPNRR